MLSNRKRAALAAFFIAAFMFMSFSPLVATAQTLPYSGLPSESKNGPYVDKVVFKPILTDDAQVLSLVQGDTDMIFDMVDTDYLAQLEAAENVEAIGIQRNGYGHYTINCAKYPLNITAFRRAFAYALDKYEISQDLWGGASQPWDSVIPPGPWSINDQFTYYYYEPEIEIANQLLDDAGFLDIDADGVREAPDGSEFSVPVAGHYASNIATGAAQIGAQALQDIGIDATFYSTDFYEYISRLSSHGDHDITFYGYSWGSDFRGSVQVLYYHYYGPLADFQDLNVVNFRNSTYDSYFDQFWYSTDYQDVFDAAAAMQNILHYECPRVIAYNNIDYTAIRTDTFEGHVAQAGANLPNDWTLLKVHKKASAGGPYGGTFRVSQGEDINSFNYMNGQGVYTYNILGPVWLAMVENDENADYLPVLAESWETQDHSTHPAIVPEGHTRFIFDLIQNATWSDGTLMTAEDVAFTLNYYRDSLQYGNAAGAVLQDLSSAFADGPFRVVIEFDTESFWHFDNVAYLTPMPKHVIEPFGLDGWDDWNPIMGADEYVTSGPFTVTDYVAGEFTELTYRDDWAYSLERPGETTTEPTVTTTPPPTTFDPMLAIVAGAVGAAVVILVGGFVLLRQK
jgi:ABC-type transport system substrate-binding protein